MNIGGAEMLLMDMLEAFQKENHPLHVAYFTDGPLRQRVTELGIPFTRLSKKGLKDPRLIFRIMGLINSFKPDVVHTHLSKSDFSGQLGAALLRVPARVLTIHNTNPWRKNWLSNNLMGLGVAGCQKMIAVSPVVKEYTAQWSNYAADKMVVIENGIDLNRFNIQTVTALDKNQSWGIAADAPTVGIVGRLDPQKGHTVFLQAAQIISRQIPAVKFIIIGDGPLRLEIETQIKELGLESEVIMAGTVRDIPGALAVLDIITFSSIFEGLPVALLEAMAMRRPVVSTAVGGIPAVITDDYNGLLVPPENPERLAKQIITVLQNPDLADRLAAAASQTIQEKYSASVMHHKTIDLYQSLLKNNTVS
jgi:glycosyltransferase involved in cell wall biosynthesis